MANPGTVGGDCVVAGGAYALNGVGGLEDTEDALGGPTGSKSFRQIVPGGEVGSSRIGGDLNTSRRLVISPGRWWHSWSRVRNTILLWRRCNGWFCGFNGLIDTRWLIRIGSK